LTHAGAEVNAFGCTVRSSSAVMDTAATSLLLGG